MTNPKRLLGLFLLASFLCLFAPSGAFAQEGSEKVTAVEVEGNKIVSTATVLAKVKTRPGDLFNQATVDEDIKRLYGTGFFTDVSADVRPYRDGKLVRFLIQERPLVSAIVISGVHHFREAKIREDLKTKEQQLLDRRELKEDAEKIRQLYRTKGFYLADIATDVKVDEPTNKATVYFKVNESSKIRVRRVHFKGNRVFSDRRLRKVMATKQGWWFTAGYYRPEVLEEDNERIKAVYRAEGYADAEVSSEAEFDDPKRWLTVEVTVAEGKRYLVGQVDLKGARELPLPELAPLLKLTQGKPFSQEGISRDTAELQGAYFAKGYMSAMVEPSTRFNTSTDRVDILYAVSEGSVAYVGGVQVKGNVKTRDVVIRRELRIAPGERFDGEKLRRSKERLYNLGYFEEVAFETVPSGRPNERDLVVTVKESKTGEFSFGAGFSSLDKLVGFAEITQKNFDLFNWPSFTGGGQELTFRTLGGTRRRNFELSFTEPWVLNRPYLFGFDFFNTTRTRGEGYSFDLNRFGGDLRLGKALNDYNRVDGIYRLERVRVSDVPDTASAALRDEVGRNTLSGVGLSFTRDTRDNVFNPKKGYQLKTGAEIAGSFLGGERDFWKWTSSGGYFLEPFIPDQVLEFRLTLGLANELGDSTAVPVFERFFAGGADSIRGYRERRVGPRDPVNNDPIGGEAMAIFNVEYTVPLLDFLKGAAFVDVGNVWNRVGEFAQEGFKSGVGAGVRIKTPFGPVKLDYGFPINPDSGEKKSGRVHFSASRGF
ncbi:MAG: outer membrane protein assembly factor BamA [Candidatus Omnitrophica bacterium]|nr:outer membrane protein assembly factor BamA [Candidatus Omnitrophota bacterium]